MKLLYRLSLLIVLRQREKTNSMTNVSIQHIDYRYSIISTDLLLARVNYPIQEDIFYYDRLNTQKKLHCLHVQFFYLDIVDPNALYNHNSKITFPIKSYFSIDRWIGVIVFFFFFFFSFPPCLVSSIMFFSIISILESNWSIVGSLFCYATSSFWRKNIPEMSDK